MTTFKNNKNISMRSFRIKYLKKIRLFIFTSALLIFNRD